MDIIYADEEQAGIKRQLQQVRKPSKRSKTLPTKSQKFSRASLIPSRHPARARPAAPIQSNKVISKPLIQKPRTTSVHGPKKAAPPPSKDILPLTPSIIDYLHGKKISTKISYWNGGQKIIYTNGDISAPLINPEYEGIIQANFLLFESSNSSYAMYTLFLLDSSDLKLEAIVWILPTLTSKYVSNNNVWRF